MALRTIGPDELKKCFPKLDSGNYERVSKATARYNCVAFAAGDERHWWQAGLNGGRYRWPSHVKQAYSVEAVVEIFASEGFEKTDNREIEPGWEKIAIYVSLSDMDFSHVTMSDGLVWKSKLGKGQDIHHYSLEVLEGDQADEYGIVDYIMKRPIK